MKPQRPFQAESHDPRAPAVYGKPLTFSAPGNYRIRAIATDEALFSTYDVKVTVKPGASAAAR